MALSQAGEGPWLHPPAPGASYIPSSSTEGVKPSQGPPSESPSKASWLVATGVGQISHVPSDECDGRSHTPVKVRSLE